MKFLTPAAFGFLALAIPILLLYMLKLRRKPVQVSSTLLWEQLLRDRQANAPWQKLRRNLLLFLQLLILAALSLALARPAVQTPVVASGSLIVLLDASASMNADDVTPSRFEAARRAVQDLIARLPPASRLTLILVGQTPQVLAAAETDPARLREALSSAQVTQGSADWQAAFALAAGAAQGSREVTTVIVSDGGLPEKGLPALPGEMRYLPIGADDDNLAVTALALRASVNGLQLFAEVTNYSQVARDVLLSFYLGDALLTARRLSLAPASSQSLTLDDLPDQPGVYQARLSDAGGSAKLDALSLDDSAFAVYQAASARRVLLVSDGNLFLEQVLAALPGIQPFRALPGPDGAPQIPAQPFDLYVLDGLVPQPLPPGNLLFVNPVSNPLFQVGESFGDMSGLQVQEHPLTRFVDWSNVHVMQARGVQLPPWAETLVGAQAGPLVFAGEIASPLGTGNRRIAALTFDLRESDLPLQVAYPILFANLLDYLVPPSAFDATRALQPGESLSILPPPGVEQVVVVSPSKTAYAFTPLAGAITFTETGELGYYAVNFIVGESQTFQTFAVNLFDPTESDIRPRATIQVGSAQVAPSVAEQVGQREVWPWLAGLALLVLLVEWQAYHRRTFHSQSLISTPMTFTSPLFLLLLLLAPLVAWVGWPAPGAALSRSKGPGKKREIVSLILRLVILACLVLSLAGMEIVRGGDDLAVVFLVDVSDSMPPAAVSAEMDYLRQALTSMGPDDQAAIVLFGADALVERPMRAGAELGRVTSAPVTNQTDLAEAIRLGLALFPPGAARRMVILSDGAQTSGDALAAARLAAASGVQIVVAPFVTETVAEALVTQVDAPARLRPGEQFDLNVTVQASQPMRAEVRVLAADATVYQAAHDLRRGTQTFSLPLTAGAPGFVTYQVQITPEGDSFYQNNRLDAFSLVEGPPRLLMVAPAAGEVLPGGGTRPDESSALLAALQAAGFTVELVTPAYLPAHLPSLAQYNAVLLVDVPARQLGLNQMEALQTYVRDLGGGLAAVGGPSSFGVGGYYDTPLEAALPVDMQIKDEQRRPKLAMVFIIDHSGSMSETSGGVTKLDLAKEAVARSLDLVFPTDRIGVIAFDDAASWVVPMTDLTEPDAALAAVGSIQIGGGTDILAGLQAMAKVLPEESAKVKHVILLTDGGADPTGIPELVERLYTADGITLSTVGVGRDAAPFLEDLAALGGGRYHFTADPGSIPSIFTEETTLATRAYLVEETFFPKQASPSPILAGISSLPALRGYVASSPKPLAQVVLESDKGDPILATWQYGLGRSLAFTSDATGRWAHDWLRSEQFAVFWAQAVRSVLSETRQAALEMDIALQGEQARLTLDALDLSGAFLNGYQVQASLVAPDGEAQSLTLRQTAPGRYEADFAPTQQGVYLIRFSGHAPDGGNFAETAGWTLSYSPEYRRLDPDPDLLLRLAALSGGELTSPDPARAFSHDLVASRASRPAWPWLLALAALLLPFDVASRRLILTRQDFLRLRAALTRSRRPAPVPLPADARLDALRRARDRARAAGQASLAVHPNVGEPAESSVASSLSRRSSRPAGTPLPEPTIPPKPSSGEAAPGAAASPLGTAETLLKRKQARRSQNEGRRPPPSKEE